MEFKEIPYNDIQTKTANTVTRLVETGERNLISINEISADKVVYAEVADYMTKELVSTKTDRIALFANEILTDGVSTLGEVKYILQVNGRDYEVVPINSNRSGLKLIKQYGAASHNTLVIGEAISSAKLKIILKASNENVTPYLSNIKVAFGKEVL